jgi:hypothetical protein
VAKKEFLTARIKTYIDLSSTELDRKKAERTNSELILKAGDLVTWLVNLRPLRIVLYHENCPSKQGNDEEIPSGTIGRVHHIYSDGRYPSLLKIYRQFSSDAVQYSLPATTLMQSF